MVKKLLSALHTLCCVVLVVQLTGCGTLMYPERRGQKAGNVDVGVAILDGLGLLLFIVPGVIAFAVDFSNGTIYLPATARSSLDLKDIKQVKFDPKHSSIGSIERMVKAQTGYAVKFDQADMTMTKLRSTNDMLAKFALIFPEVRDERIVLNK